LTENYDIILADLNPLTEIYYYESMQDVEDWNALDWQPGVDITAYQATSNPQTIYVRVQDFNSECFIVRTFDLVTVNCGFTAPDPVFLCDNDKDDFESIDLSQYISDILTGFEDHSVSFHSSENGANTDNITDVIDHTLPYQVSVGTTVTVWIRLEDNLETTEFQVESFTITVYDSPDIDFIEGMALELCDDDTDGSAIFNLTTIGNTITDTIPDLVISYYTSETNAQEGTGAIVNPGAFSNTVNPQTIWVKAVDANGCYGISWIVLEVNPLPDFN